MSENVFEWIEEFYQFYSMSEALHDDVNDAIRLIRGGSFTEVKSTNRIYWRAGTLRNVASDEMGFRFAQ